VYLLGLKFNEAPSLTELATFRPDEALRCLRVGDLALLKGDWPVLGDALNWAREYWPTPTFVRRDDLSKRVWRVYYDDAAPSGLEREELASNEISAFESAGLYGCGAVAILLAKLLVN